MANVMIMPLANKLMRRPGIMFVGLVVKGDHNEVGENNVRIRRR